MLGGLPIRERPKIGKLLSLEFLDDWDVLIIYKLDRGFRNHLDFVAFSHEFCERYGKKVVSVGEEGLDMSTPMGLVPPPEPGVVREGSLRQQAPMICVLARRVPC